MKLSLRHKLILQLGGLYVIVGILIALPAVQRSLRIQTAQQLESTSHPTEYREGEPVRLFLPRLGLNLVVIRGAFSEHVWDTNPTKALYAVNTMRPNNTAGNTLIYGHNTQQVFFATRGLAVGDLLFVYTQDHQAFQYVFTHEETVAPEDVSIFSYVGKPQITLLTCEGLFNAHRKLMYFRFLQVQ